MSTEKVAVREFRASLADFLDSDVPVAVTRHGRTVGVFVPTHGDRLAARAALRTSAAAARQELEAKGVRPEDVLSDFDTARKPTAG